MAKDYKSHMVFVRFKSEEKLTSREVKNYVESAVRIYRGSLDPEAAESTVDPDSVKVTAIGGA